MTLSASETNRSSIGFAVPPRSPLNSVKPNTQHSTGRRHEQPYELVARE
jgi:hypothetical protein